MSDQAKATAQLYRWDEVEREEINPLLVRQFLSGERMMLARICLKRGCVVPLHSHENEQISYIVSGALEFMVEGVSTIVRAGEILVIPSHAQHSATALEDSEDLDLFAPPRQDWITARSSHAKG